MWRWSLLFRGVTAWPVVLENDVNAAAIGFARCYETEFPGEDPAETNMAYLHFDRGCVSAGFVAGAA